MTRIPSTESDLKLKEFRVKTSSSNGIEFASITEVADALAMRNTARAIVYELSKPNNNNVNARIRLSSKKGTMSIDFKL